MSWNSFNKNIANGLRKINQDIDSGVFRCPVCDKAYKTYKEERQCSDSHVQYGNAK